MNYISNITNILQKCYRHKSYPQFAVERAVDKLWINDIYINYPQLNICSVENFTGYPQFYPQV